MNNMNNNLSTNYKKNVIITLVFVLIFLLLYLYINYQLQMKVNNELVMVPYLKIEVVAGEKITDDMIWYKEIPYREVDKKYEGKIETDINKIIGKCVKKGMELNSYFELNNLKECPNNYDEFYIDE